ncbi:uncharacterized protein [Miscanthus floridulus]|uniref:uncharacterized protein n=1 Tax=Miscanthus floridulus TaxID=154761 RepID=UPI00345ADD38
MGLFAEPALSEVENRSPFEVLYRHPPRHFGLSPPEASSVPDAETMLTKRSTMLNLVRQHLLRAQHRMKLYADKHRSERSFNIGDMVFLKVQPYVQASLAPRAHQKPSFRYFGSYKVLEKIGAVAYKLDLLESSSVHPIFHVSLLKATLLTKFPFSVDPLESVEGLQVPEVELEQQLANAEEYNDNLHEEVHQLNNQLHPYVPPGAVELDLDEDEDPEELEAPTDDDNDDVDSDNVDISDLDIDHDE